MPLDDCTAYKGEEAYWAALCAYDGVTQSEQWPDPASVASYIDDVWPFVIENCQNADQPIPDKDEATGILREMLEEYLNAISNDG